jgi:phage anti-repressor protein
MNELIKVNNDGNKITILGRDLHKFLEIGTDYHIWFPRMLEYGFVEKTDYIAIEQKRTIGIGKGLTDHQLTLDMAKEISMLQRNEKGKQARQYFIECEKKLKSKILPQDYKSALYELIRKEEEKELLILENKQLTQRADEAEKTKAWISDKKTATAMVTASYLSRECNKLREEIGFCKKHATIKRMEILTKDKYRYKVLRDYCKAKELDITKVPDVNYGFVNAYPADAWYSCYNIDLDDLFN